MTNSSTYLREVARYLDDRPRSAAVDLAGGDRKHSSQRRQRPQSSSNINASRRSSTRDGGVNIINDGNDVTVVSLWSPVPGGSRATYASSDYNDSENASGGNRLLAYRNGDRLCGVFLRARSFPSVLRKATMKLRLPRPARRIFLEDGTEAFDAEQLGYGGAVFVSMGEEFRGAQLTSFQIASGRIESDATLTIQKRRAATAVSRLNELVGSVASRILVLRNGDSLPNGDLSEVAVELKKPGWLRNLYVQATVRLSLPSYGRQMFNIRGQLITDVDELPRLPVAVLSLLTDGSAFGPVWIGCGDEFRPNAAADFAKRLLKRINKTLKERKVGVDMTEEEHDQLEDFKPELNDLIDELRSMGPNEQPSRPPSASQTFECIRLKMFENGDVPSSPHFRNITFPLSDVVRRLPSRKDDGTVLKSLFAYCGETASGKKIRRMFMADGQEVQNMRQLESDQAVWCSGGEAFIPYTQAVLAITLDQLRIHRLANSLLSSITAESGLLSNDERQAKRIAVRVQVPPTLLESLLVDKSRAGWLAQPEWGLRTDEVSTEEVADVNRAAELLARAGSLRSTAVQVPKRKQRMDGGPFCLCADIVAQADQRLAANKADLAPLLQKWLIDEKGIIRSRVLPQLALAVDTSDSEMIEFQVMASNNNERRTIAGCRRLLLLPVTSSGADRKWTFTNDGRVQSVAYPDLVLTFSGMSVANNGDDDNNNNAGMRRSPTWAVAAPRQTSQNLAELQQWALRPTACWEKRPKTPKRLNPEWHARALWWPTREFSFAGNYVSVNFVAMAPPITRASPNAGSLGDARRRIFVLPNGCDDLSRAVPIVIDDQPVPHCDLSFDSYDSPNRDPTVRHFLSHCTSLLMLPSAGRRLFNTNGQELSSLEGIEADQLLYISCGEKYIDLAVTDEQRRTRFLRQMLSADAAKLRAFCAIHSPNNAEMVVGFEGTAEPGTKLVILPMADTSSDFAVLASMSARSGATTATSASSTTAATGNNSTSNSTVVGEGLTKRRFIHARFRWADDGYLETMGTANKSLCLSVSPKEGLTRDVSLELRRPDDPLQQWTVDREGFIRCRYQTRYVLAVQLPDVLSNAASPFGSGVSPLVGAFIGVQQLRPSQFGRANQLFRFDRSSGRMFPFAANQRDLDITAASAAGICTGSVCAEEIDQVGYQLDRVSLPPSLAAAGQNAFGALTICYSCARAVRGCGCQLDRLTKPRDFRCALSDQHQRQLFLAACASRSPSVAASLGATVRTLYTLDVSADSVAEDTLTHWEQQLFELTKSQQVEPNLAPSAAVVNAPLVWILARSVGTGIETGPPPVLVAGRSMDELLIQCTEKLALAFAARAMYAKDGARFVDTHAISDWIAENDEHVTERARILAAQRCPDLIRLLQPDEYGRASPVESNFWARPVEVWVTDGKAFEKPEDIDRKVNIMTMRFKDEHRESYQYDTERSRLKGMEARRKNTMNGQQFVNTEDPSGPVALEGGWKARAAEEVQLSNKLQSTARTSRSGAGTESARSAASSRAATSAREVMSDDQLLRIRAYENGSNADSAVFVWGTSVAELLRNATTRLVLRKPAKRLFALPVRASNDKHATEVLSMQDMVRDQLVAVSTGLNFISAEAARGAVGVKAEWSRARRQFGPSATDMPVVAQDLAAQASARAPSARFRSSDQATFHVEEPMDD